MTDEQKLVARMRRELRSAAKLARDLLGAVPDYTDGRNDRLDARVRKFEARVEALVRSQKTESGNH